MYSRNPEGFLHVIDSNVEITGDIQRFLDSVEEMMGAFSLKSWFNTVCDGCNYVLTKYNPRVSVKIDVPDAKKLKGKTIHWCSNANLFWVCFDRSASKVEDVLLDEKFDIPMFFIIEFLAQRRNRKSPGDLEYMNMYPGIDEEIGAFRNLEQKDAKGFSQKKFAEEDMVFRQLEIDNHADMDVNMIIEDVKRKIS